MTNLPADISLRELIARIKVIMPPQYQDCIEDVSPVSMGSAPLRFGPDGRVEWDGIWTHFCDLALAGGPPHRGTLLSPCSPEEVIADEANYQRVVNEIGRGIFVITGLPVLPRFADGWIGVRCPNETMAAWLLRAVIAENVLARQDGHMLFLPASPRFRLEKEIKNVIVAFAKTCHYWTGHMGSDQKERLASMFIMDQGQLVESPLADDITKNLDQFQAMASEIGQAITESTGYRIAHERHSGWIGIVCHNVRMAVWMMRGLIAENVLARREGETLYVPVWCPERVISAVTEVFRLWGIYHKSRQQA